MAENMTIYDAVDAFELFELFNEVLDTYETDFYTRSEIDADLRDLIEEHDDLYEFVPDEEGRFGESFERNLKEALGIIFDEHGVEVLFDDDFMDEAMDDEDIAGIYNDGLEEGSGDADAGYEDEDGLY